MEQKNDAAGCFFVPIPGPEAEKEKPGNGLPLMLFPAVKMDFLP